MAGLFPFAAGLPFAGETLECRRRALRKADGHGDKKRAIARQSTGAESTFGLRPIDLRTHGETVRGTHGQESPGEKELTLSQSSSKTD